MADSFRFAGHPTADGPQGTREQRNRGRFLREVIALLSAPLPGMYAAKKKRPAAQEAQPVGRGSVFARLLSAAFASLQELPALPV
jgi:hypothetical protein